MADASKGQSREGTAREGTSEQTASQGKGAQGIASREDFAQWYLDLVYKTGLADESPVRGCMVIRPYGYALWEHMVRLLDERIKATGHENVYFPLFIPRSFMEREAEHIEGFAPEVAVVTHAGGEELAEPLIVRPTSETIIGHMYAQWVHSYRDLPLLYNQWANVVRWEKRTRPFLRTTEFLWQEGHTVHRTEEEAEDETMLILQRVYQDFLEKELAIPVIAGRKSEGEKFAGALRTYSLEAMMGDGRALQCATSHNLGQNFAHSFNITFQDADGEVKHAWTTSWGASTRMIGGLIMTHGDDSGLRMPPRVAPIQAIIVPIWRKETEREAVAALVTEVEGALRAQGVRVRADWREERPGFKYNDWELRGVPIRIEIGPRDAQQGQVVLVPRTDRAAKQMISKDAVVQSVRKLLDDIQRMLYDQALAFRQRRTYQATSFDELRALMADRARLGFVEGWWCGDAACEATIKAETQATLRCLPLAQPTGSGACVGCGRPGTAWGVFAKAY
ncbi:MAG: proline--tRNA ligase [Ktedonobacterales bacterium]|nr:proline--tRNA ligase [Ktedonobacterales bacterium]